MSAQAVSSAPTTRRPVERRNAATSRRVTPRPRPRVRTVPAAPSARRAPFLVVVVLLLGAGLLGLLALNTVLAQGSFRLSDLQREVAALDDQQQALEQRVARLAAPQRLARQAAGLGMVPTVDPTFLRSSDGVVLGRPKPAPGVAPSPVTPDPAATPSHAATGTGRTGTPAPAGPTGPSGISSTVGLGPGVAATTGGDPGSAAGTGAARQPDQGGAGTQTQGEAQQGTSDGTGREASRP